MSGIAIIGAGIAGLSAAATLSARRASPILYDKGRGPGGRIASREAGAFRFDHGPPFFIATDDELRDLLNVWAAQGLVAPWAAEASAVGTPSMRAPLLAMAAAFAVHRSTHVRSLDFSAGQWRVTAASADEEPPTVSNDVFDGLILAVPAPQAADLLETAGIMLPELSQVEYAPCWAVMLACAGTTGIERPHLVLPEGPIASITRDDLKPGRSGNAETLVIQASAAWSRAHLEEEAVAVAAALLREFETLAGRAVHPLVLQAHRWRYANVETTLGRISLDRPDLHLGLCGDWCLGGGIAGAFKSGRAAAESFPMPEGVRG